MKCLLTVIMATSLALPAMARPALQTISEVEAEASFFSLPVAEQEEAVSAAKEELRQLRGNLLKERAKVAGAAVLGITSLTATVVLGYISYLGIRDFLLMAAEEKIAVGIIGAITGVAALGTGTGAAKSFIYLQVKSEEIDQLLKEIETAEIALAAAERVYKTLLVH